MPQQLIYTSSPRGLVIGRSGYCTVARSDGLREGLQLRLEQLSYFSHSAATGGRERPVFAHRLVDIRGSRFHVLSRIVDAGLDFTNRTNFLAHHLVFQPHEVASLPSPPVIFQHWSGWRNAWPGEPQLLSNENWGNLGSIVAPACAPAREWAALTGDAVNAIALLDSRPQESFLVDGLEQDRTLPLLAESLAMFVTRPGTGNPWGMTFTTFLQEQDDPADFRWRLAYTSTPGHNRLLARNSVVKPLAGLRCERCDELAAAYARSGPQPLQITVQPEDQRMVEGGALVLKAVVSGIPPPTQYQWYACSRDGSRQPLPGAVHPEFRVSQLPLGVTRFLVVVGNGSGGSVESRVAQVSVERKQVRVAAGRPGASGHQPSPASATMDDALAVKAKHPDRGDWGEDDTLKNGSAKERKSDAHLWVIIAFLVLGVVLTGLIYWAYNHDKTELGKHSNTDTNRPPASTNSAPPGISPGSTGGPPAETFGKGGPGIDKPKSYLFLVLPDASKTSLRDLTDNQKEVADKIRAKQAELAGLDAKIKKNIEDIQSAKHAVADEEAEVVDRNSLAISASPPFKGPRERRDYIADHPHQKELVDLWSKFDAAVIKRDQAKAELSAKETENKALLDSKKTKLPQTIRDLQVQKQHLNSLTDDKNHREKFHKDQNEELQKCLANLYSVPNGQTVFYRVDDYSLKGSTQTNFSNLEVNSSTIPIQSGKITIGDLKLAWNANQFSIQEFDVSQETNRLAAPISVVFFKDKMASGLFAEFILWPSDNPFTVNATCEAQGHLVITNQLELIQSLNRLESGRDFHSGLRASYLDSSCTTNFDKLSTHYYFEALAQLLVTNAVHTNDWLAEQAAATKFIQFREITTKSKTSPAPFWDELDQMCLKAIGKPPDQRGGRLFDFAKVDYRPKAYEDLRQRAGSLELPFTTADLPAIDQFLSECPEANTLDKIRAKLGELIPRGRLDTGRLQASIWLNRRSKPTPPVELVRLKFSQASKAQTQDNQ